MCYAASRDRVHRLDDPANGPIVAPSVGSAVMLVGSDDFEMRVKSRSPWTINHQFATTISRGRVFCAGDAVHRHPPTNGLGSNTSIQDK